MEHIRILVVDDHPIVREGLKLIFETEEQFEISDEAANGKEALMLIECNKYDLILLDIRMPIMDGVEFLKEKDKLMNETRVVVLTTADDIQTFKNVMKYGVKCFMLKDSSRDEMFRTVKAALRDEVFLSDEVKKIFLEENTGEKNIDETSSHGLTERELSILTSVVSGAASKEIAVDMGITERTVKAHLTNIYKKLSVNSRSEAVAVAITRKIVVVSQGTI